MHVSATAYSQRTKLTLELRNQSIKEALYQIENQSEFRFIYEKEQINLDRKISVHLKNQTVESILDHLLGDESVRYEITENNLILIYPAGKRPGNVGIIDRPETESNQQGIRITGTVVDEKSEPVIGANIVEKGTANGTVTQEDGNFSLTVAENATLQISFIGYIPQEISAVGGGKYLIIRLIEDEKILEEVIVIGYGTVRKSDLTGAVSSVSSEKVSQVKAVSNIAHALQGLAAGVQANQRSGQPGESVMIKVRGTNSIGASNAPLYVVDGMLLESLSAQLNPGDIQNIEILKDASATAIYGSRGANGVVMITTKRGSEGKAAVNYNGYFGVQQLRKKIELTDASEFATLQNEVAANDGNPLPWTAAQIGALGKGTDWQDEVYRSGMVHNHDISITGGTANTKYYSSLGYFDQEGIIQNSSFERLSFRINVDQEISKKIDLSTNLSIQNSKYVQAVYTGADGGGGIPFTTMVMPATQGIYNDDGTYTRFTGVSWGETNPVGISKELYNPSNGLRIIGNLRLNYEIVDGLSLRINAGLDLNNSKSDYYAPSTLTIGQSSQGNGRASKNYSNGMSFLNENLLTYAKTFGDHNLDLLGGYTYQYDQSESLNSGTATGFISDVYQNNNLGAANVKAQPGTGYSDAQLTSGLGRVNYNYKNRYYATFTGRYDGSSRFGENNKYAFFPSGALVWRVSEEAFMQKIESISNLKLRTSYGISGNQAIGSYQTLARLNNVNVYMGGQDNTGFVQGSLEYKNLKWESTAQFDVGIDLNLFKDRIQLTADFYNKKTKDLLLDVTMPPSTGFGSVLQNAGSVQNRGWEFQVTTVNVNRKALRWTSVLTLMHNRTKILNLGSDALGNPITYKEVGAGGNWFPMLLGQSMQQLYGYVVEGVYQSDGEAVQNGEPTKKAGDYKFRDTDGSGIVDGDDRIILTNFEPKLTFGFNNTLEYKNFDLSVLFVGSHGNDMVNEFRKYNITMNGDWMPSREAFNNRWQGPGTGNSIDRPSKASGSSIRDYANSLWVENGSYLKIRDITLGYTFPSLKFASSLYVYVSAQNWLTWTSYSGYDPEVSWSLTTINGWDRGNYPSTKSITGGLKVTF
ncbi:MAG: TonB-dependent receptor [Tannerella sp.]|nr:TonB-dependent receptor [Tannerella sp.]